MGIAINHVQLPDSQKNRLMQGNVGISGGRIPVVSATLLKAVTVLAGGGRVLPPATLTFT